MKQVFPLADASVHTWFKNNESRVVDDVCNKSRVVALVIKEKVAISANSFTHF